MDISLFNINDPWFEKYGSVGLQIGDTLPDLPLGTVINNHTGKTKFSDFKGKLLILDFWSTYCTSCISNFGYMEQLQQEFGDKIQIFLVNVFETKSDIEARFSTRFKNAIRLPNLPCIVAEKSMISIDTAMHLSALYKLFPTRGVPYHVWIDGAGVVRLKGGDLNTYSEKITSILNGDKIFVLNSSASVPSLTGDDNAPYYKQLGNLKNTNLLYGSFITEYNNELQGGSGRKEIIDSAANARINYFINEELLSIYVWGPFRKLYLGQFGDDLIYSPTLAWKDLIIFPKDIDTLKFSTRLTKYRHLTDKQYIRSKFCYEQIVPINVPESQSLQNMLDELNRYFAISYGIVAKLEEKTTPCYVLIRTSNSDKISERNFKMNRSIENYLNQHNNTSAKKYIDSDLSDVLNEVIDHTQIGTQIAENKMKGGPFLIFNQTGWDNTKKINVILPSGELKNIDDLRKTLQLYDLDVILSNKSLRFIVFENVSKL